MRHVDALLAQVRQIPHAGAATTRKICVGPFWTVVQTTEGSGMASSMASSARPHEGFPVPDAGRLHGRRPLELTEMLRSTSTTEAAVGLAAVNALLGVPRDRVTTHKATELLAKRGRDRRVALIGRFPFVESLRPHCGDLLVFERDGRGQKGDHTEEEMPALLPRAEIVAITATTLLNQTLDDILQHVAADAWTMMLGPSTPMSPVLFELGFDVLCGTVIDDAEAVISAVSQGAVTKQITGVQRVSYWAEGE